MAEIKIESQRNVLHLASPQGCQETLSVWVSESPYFILTVLFHNPGFTYSK